MPEPNVVTQVLAKVALFAGLSESESAFLAQRAVSRRFSAGELVFSEGEPCVGLYVVQSGHIRIFKSSAGGREQVLSIEGPGSSVAELPVFDGGNYPASVVAIDDATLLFISKQDFQTLCLTHPQVALKVLRVVGARLRRLVGIIEELSFTTVRHRLAAFLLRLAQKEGKRTADGVEVTHEPLIGNEPTSGTIVWSVVSFFLLLAGVGGMVWYFASQPRTVAEELLPESDPLLGLHPTPSQRATVKFFFVVAALWVVQVALGAITAHYGVEGSGFYGIPLDRWLPYSVTRTWHLQIGIFWIATSWLATGLYVAPAVSGYEPKGQRLGVNALFGALMLVVVGSLAGEWMSIQHKLGNLWFWFGTQGYEYVDLGRFWQILLFGGLVFWLWLMWRSLKPALAKKDQSYSLLLMFVISSIAIPLFYAAGLMYGQRSNLVTAEYWRWWVVHLWVEGFFEVFATVVIAFLLTRLKLLSVPTATRAVLFSTVVFLSGGIIGTFHHLYFAGTPNIVLGLGAVFSALEVVPLVLIGFEAWENIRLAQSRQQHIWVAAYKWPIYFFVAVAFWNFVGAGLFGFLINPPIALYYMQGLNTTPVHGHTALFGVYGMLGLGLMLFCLRALRPGMAWKNTPLAFAFWSINIGLALMVLISMLPIGIMQAWASVEYGTWYARSAEFLHSGGMNQLRWMRMIGDSLFALGALTLGWFVLGLVTGHSYDRRGYVAEGEWTVRPQETVALPR